MNARGAQSHIAAEGLDADPPLTAEWLGEGPPLFGLAIAAIVTDQVIESGGTA